MRTFCCMQCVGSAKQNKTKQKCNLFCRRHTLRGAQYKTQHNGTERGRKLSQDTNWNINNKTCTTAKMHCRCQELGKNDYALGNESDPGESLFLWIFPPEERKTNDKTFLCRSRDLFPGHIWWSTPLFLILNPQAVLSRSAYKPNNLKNVPSLLQRRTVWCANDTTDKHQPDVYFQQPTADGGRKMKHYSAEI